MLISCFHLFLVVVEERNSYWSRTGDEVSFFRCWSGGFVISLWLKMLAVLFVCLAGKYCFSCGCALATLAVRWKIIDESVELPPQKLTYMTSHVESVLSL